MNRSLSCPRSNDLDAARPPVRRKVKGVVGPKKERFGMTDIVTRLVISAQTSYTRLRERQEGQALVEYALILALVSVVAIASLELIGEGVVAKLGEVATAL